MITMRTEDVVSIGTLKYCKRAISVWKGCQEMLAIHVQMIEYFISLTLLMAFPSTACTTKAYLLHESFELTMRCSVNLVLIEGRVQVKG